MPTQKPSQFNYRDLPKKISPFTFLGFVPQDQSGNEYIGDCPICGGEGKFYVNGASGLFSCKHGACQEQGNTEHFINAAFKAHKKHGEFGHAKSVDWEILETDRRMNRDILQKMGLIKINSYWLIPVKDSRNIIVSFRTFKVGQKVQAVRGLSTGLYGSEQFSDKTKIKCPVYICEGEWDKAATEAYLEINKQDAIVVGTPGAGVFKDEWLHYLAGRDIITLYDSDIGGTKGTARLNNLVSGICNSHKSINWPEGVPAGFDMRDFITRGGEYSAFKKMIKVYEPDAEIFSSESEAIENEEDDEEKSSKKYNSYPSFKYNKYPLLSSGERPTLEKTIGIFENNLLMTPEMKGALRVIYAAIITAQFSGEPLWIHIAAPPGWAKTELLLSTQHLANIQVLSSTTAAGLISGARMKDGFDPSLLPRLFGKTLVLKDYTEILRMTPTEKLAIHNILRGAYDGVAQRIYGNGVPSRKYEGFFNILTGVTHEIFADVDASVGERFLIFKVTNDPNCDPEQQIRAALRLSGKEEKMRAALAEASTNFLSYQVKPEDIPQIPKEYENQIVSLAQMVGALRTVTSKNTQRGTVNYRPQSEIGTRLAKQLAKLAIGLGLQRWPAKITEEDMKLVMHTALSTCISWNLEMVYHLAKKPKQEVDDISSAADIPVTTVREHIEDMYMVGIVDKYYAPNPIGRGRSIAQFTLAPFFQKFWNGAKMNEYAMYSPKKDQIQCLLRIPRISQQIAKRKIRRAKISDEPVYDKKKPMIRRAKK